MKNTVGWKLQVHKGKQIDELTVITCSLLRTNDAESVVVRDRCKLELWDQRTGLTSGAAPDLVIDRTPWYVISDKYINSLADDHEEMDEAVSAYRCTCRQSYWGWQLGKLVKKTITMLVWKKFTFDIKQIGIHLIQLGSVNIDPEQPAVQMNENDKSHPWMNQLENNNWMCTQILSGKIRTIFMNRN